MRTYRSRFVVAWSHCDSAGIVFYPNFQIWFDQATEKLFSANGLSYPELARDFGVTGMPLIETGTTFRFPCRLGDEIDQESWVDEWSTRAFLLRHRINLAGGVPAVEGFERRVLMTDDPGSSRGIRAIAFPESAKRRFVD